MWEKKELWRAFGCEDSGEQSVALVPVEQEKMERGSKGKSHFKRLF